MRLGLFGGTFDPVHYGHLRAAEEAREALGLDLVLFVPAGNPPLRQAEDAAHRLRMVELAVRGNPGFKVSDMECAKEGLSYTVQTVAELKDRMPRAEIILILGVDAFLDVPKWRGPEELTGMVDFAVLSRPGFGFGALSSSPYVMPGPGDIGAIEGNGSSAAGAVKEAALKSGKRLYMVSVSALGISATAIRGLVQRGASVSYLLPKDVESYIISKGLYLQEEGSKG